MRLKTYGSGSKGNSHTLTSSTGATLVLDAGVNYKKILSEHKPSTIEAVLITHSHGDHNSQARHYVDNFIKVYAPYKDKGIITISTGEIICCGEYRVKAFEMKHDVPCVGFLIRHPEINGDILYATDTNGIPWSFDTLALAMIEADYDTPTLRKNVEENKVHLSVAQRTAKTHQSLRQAIAFLQNQVKTVYKAVFLHLSGENANGDQFIAETKKALDTPVFIAKPGFEIKIDKFEIFN